MGTYTTNYNLFMPTVGETGWGTLVNGNFTTIDTTMKGLDTRITAIENEVNGNLSCTGVTTSGKVTANGGVGTTSLTASGNITSSGTISATKIKQTDVTTVSTSLPSSSDNLATIMEEYTCILPYCGHNYTGSLKIRVVDNSSWVKYVTSLSGFRQSTTSGTIAKGGTYTLSFTNAPCLYVILHGSLIFDSLTLS